MKIHEKPLWQIIHQASQFPWPKDPNECESEGGTTCSEANANRCLARHAANLLPELLKVLDLWKPEADYDSEDELNEAIKFREEMRNKIHNVVYLVEHDQ